MVESIDLTHLLVLLIAAVLAVPLFQRFGLGGVLGYLFAGALIGPWGIGAIEQVEQIQHIAEFGVVFLLFIIGIELNFKRLWQMRRLVFGLGSAQVLLTAAALGFASFMMIDMSIQMAIVIGFGLALSSTAFGLQILNERSGMQTVYGRTSFSILLLQDISVVPLLALVSFLSYESMQFDNGTMMNIVSMLLVIGAVIVAGRFVVNPVLALIAHSRNSEIFIAAAILVVLGTAWLMDAVGLSKALGAFMAGLVLADSYYRHQIIADIQPFRGLLLGLFFMSVGMAVDFGLFLDQVWIILSLVAGLLVIKAAIIWALCRLANTPNGASLHAGFLLSQSGEFGFVLFGLALATGLLPLDLFQILTLVIAISMVTTPFMASFGQMLEKRLGEQNSDDVKHAMELDDEKFVIIAGFGRMGRRVASILREAGVPYAALDNDPASVVKAREEGFCVIYGDASRYDVLNQIGGKNASLFVVTINKSALAERLVHIMRQYYPDTPIYARAHDRAHCEDLRKAGADIQISETLEASLTLSHAVLAAHQVPEEEIERLLTAVREREELEKKDD